MFDVDNCFRNKIDWFKIMNCNIIDDFVCERFHGVSKSVIRLNEIFDLISKFDDTTFNENDDVVDL